MNSGVWSGIVTAILLVAFVGGAIWAWSSRRKPEFDAAARMPLEETGVGPEDTKKNGVGPEDAK